MAPPSTTVREITMANPFVHVELHTRDLGKAKAFYSGLFGWELQDWPMPDGGGTYTMINVGEGTGGGMMAQERPDAMPYWLSYVGVDDVRAKTAQAKTLGATVLQDVIAVGDFGLMSVIRDPAGATIAMWQAVGGK
jgi:predicted enzyme related to lactoylglutathione lyase